MNDLTPSISACVIVVVNDLGSSEGQITFSLNSKLCTQFWVNITNDYNSLRRERVIVRQQHRKDSSCQSLRFFDENLAF